MCPARALRAGHFGHCPGQGLTAAAGRAAARKPLLRVTPPRSLRVLNWFLSVDGGPPNHAGRLVWVFSAYNVAHVGFAAQQRRGEEAIWGGNRRNFTLLIKVKCKGLTSLLTNTYTPAPRLVSVDSLTLELARPSVEQLTWSSHSCSVSGWVKGSPMKPASRSSSRSVGGNKYRFPPIPCLLFPHRIVDILYKYCAYQYCAE